MLPRPDAAAQQPLVAETNSTSAATWNGAYEAFGLFTQQSGFPSVDRQRANTKEEDPTGLLNEGMRYRDLDVLAAAIVAHAEGCDLNSVAFVCVFGAVATLDPVSLGAFAGKIVIVGRQNDVEHGKSAATSQEWCKQLRKAKAARLVLTDFSGLTLPTGRPCKDFGDYAETLTSTAPPILIAPFMPPLAPPRATPLALAGRPPLVPLESPWHEGDRYREAGACEVATRLDCFLGDPSGPWVRLSGVLQAVRSGRIAGHSATIEGPNAGCADWKPWRETVLGACVRHRARVGS